VSDNDAGEWFLSDWFLDLFPYGPVDGLLNRPTEPPTADERTMRLPASFPPSRQSRCVRPTPEDRSPLTWPASAQLERRRSKVSNHRRRSLHRHPKSPPFPVKNTSKIPQKSLINFWQRFQKNMAKTSKKDDKQNRLTPLEVRRAP
jgi:hypothetical protein